MNSKLLKKYIDESNIKLEKLEKEKDLAVNLLGNIWGMPSKVKRIRK